MYPEEYKAHRESIKRLKQGDGCTSKQQRRGTCAFTQEKYEKGVAKFILESKLPFSTVELPHFHNFIDDFDLRDAKNTPLKHMSRRTLVRRVDDLVKEKMDVIRSSMEKEAKYVCTTADVWSASTRSFLGATAHWVCPSQYVKSYMYSN